MESLLGQYEYVFQCSGFSHPLFGIIFNRVICGVHLSHSRGKVHNNSPVTWKQLACHAIYVVLHVLCTFTNTIPICDCDLEGSRAV